MGPPDLGSDGNVNLLDGQAIYDFQLVIFGEQEIQTVYPPVPFGNVDRAGKKRLKPPLRNYPDLVDFFPSSKNEPRNLYR